MRCLYLTRYKNMFAFIVIKEVLVKPLNKLNYFIPSVRPQTSYNDFWFLGLC